mmetsp:Transcript_55492/g.132287  ORF Transcript_55492/g.132287 Transcript_55492/m.132287 type:complete len:368 (-) Transcript_55492:253-1356(-)
MRGAVARTLSLASLASAVSGNVVTYSGYIIDYLCYDKCVTASSSCDKCALDRTDVIRSPQDHLVHCIRDVSVCIDSTYYLAENVGTADAPDYRPRYELDSLGNANALDVIKASGRNRGLFVTATGVDDGLGRLTGANMSECFGNCDGICLGIGCLDSARPSHSEPVEREHVHLHGACMLIAWAVLAPFAAIIKRHMTRLPFGLSEVKVGKFPIGFVIHGAMMLTAVTLTLVGGILALGAFDRRAVAGHFPIGLVVMILAIWQPLPAIFCRPEHDSPNRKYFNWVHVGGGRLCIFLGVVNVFLGAYNFRTLWDNCTAMGWFIAASLAIVAAIVTAVVMECMARRGSDGKAEPRHDPVRTIGKADKEQA